MKNLPLLTLRGAAALICGLLLVAGPVAGQVTLRRAAVRVSAVVRTTPTPQIRLVWTSDNPAGTTYTIWRKLKADASWGVPLATVPATALSYDDNVVAVGDAYEYRLHSSYASGEGYLYAGLEVAPTESRGTLVLVVDNTHAAYLANDIDLLVSDLRGDGWQVLRHDVAPAATPPVVRALIQGDYLANPTAVQAVLLLGHVAVPYSGDIYPDGHSVHGGAWPADVYYGDMSGTWADVAVNNATATRPENRNVPGDGKFDKSYLPGTPIQLQVGRVDLSRLPTFALPERDLLRRYLQKDHAFRHGQVAVAERALIADAFGYFSGEAFANNGWRNFSALVSEANITSVAPTDYAATFATQDYLLTYACGGGSYQGIGGGVIHTSDLAARPALGVFNAYFGSYFGDWDNSDNFLRGVIAGAGYSLTSVWAGRPNWELHHLGLGETVGYAARLSQAPGALYVTNYGANSIHVALMGDPSLRLHPLAPPTALAAAAGTGGRADLSWQPSPAAGVSYHVYRAAMADGPFVRLTPTALAGTTFTDPAPLAGASTYLVRAMALKTSASGSYYNLSQGAFQSFTASAPLPVSLVAFSTTRLGSVVQLNWTTASETDNCGFEAERSLDGQAWQRIGYRAGAGSSLSARSYALATPYVGLAYYRLHQLDCHGGGSYSAVRVVAADPDGTSKLTGYPNPATGVLHLTGADPRQPLQLLSNLGQVVLELPAGTTSQDVRQLPPGLYLLRQGTRQDRVEIR